MKIIVNKSNALILALPKGRVYEDFIPLLEKTQFAIKDDVKKSRKMLLDTKHPNVKVLIIRGWDVPTYITSGAAHIGIVGKDILMEKEEEEFVELADLGLGKCRLSLAGYEDVLTGSARLKIATKYPKSSTKFMNSIGIQPEIIYLNGAQEIAPVLGLSDAIIDLVDSGKTLTANGLTEIQTIADISCLLYTSPSPRD